MKVRSKQLLIDSDLDFNGNKAKGLPTPTTSDDAATKGYVDGMVGTGSVPTTDDKDLTPAVTSGNFQTTTLDITNTPFGGSDVEVFVNGVKANVGNDARTKDCYFSADGGTTARSIANIVATDTLYWNGVIAGYDLDAGDRVDLGYNSPS